MHSPILHIKDSYYFDVPKALWRHNYKSLDEVPEFLRAGHPHATLAEFNQEMDGKVLIPQPFGTLKNLYEPNKAAGGFCISKFMVLELVIVLLISAAGIIVANRLRKSEVPRGRFTNFVEAVLLFVRNNIARPAIGGGHGHDFHEADKFVPLLWTLFFFILTCNLFGLIPWAGSPTGSFSVTLALAAITFGTVLLSGTRKFGLLGFWLNQVPHMDLPWYMWILKPLIWVIEVLGLFIRHGVLAVRLLANMMAGHLVILAIMGLAFSIEAATSPTWHLAAVIAVVGSAAFSVLELFVAFLQAYVFTFLSALFIGSAVHKH